jgi:hypothetical protein
MAAVIAESGLRKCSKLLISQPDRILVRDRPRLLAYITGRVDKELLVRNEYLADENRILRAKIKGRLQLLDGEKRTLAEIAHRLGRKALAEVAMAARPDTILRWFRKLVVRKFDGSARRRSVGRPQIEKAIENLIVRMAQEVPRGATIACGGARQSRT